MTFKRTIIVLLPLISFALLYVFGRSGGTLCTSNDGCGLGPLILIFGFHAFLSLIFFLVLKSPLEVLLSIALTALPFAGTIGYFIGSETGPKKYCGLINDVENCQICTTPLFNPQNATCVDIP